MFDHFVWRVLLVCKREHRFLRAGILRTVAPSQTFALGSDSGLKLRALRNPWCRAKAMELYGITIPATTADGQVPDLGQLLHTRPGDNCPICRQRALMEKAAGDL